MTPLIGYFISSKDSGGAEIMATDLAQAVTNTFNAVVYGFNDSWMKEHCKRKHVHFIPLPDDVTKYWGITKLPIFGYKFGQMLKNDKVTLLHSHLYGASLRGAAASYFAGIPHVTTLHDSYTITDKPSRVKWLKIATKFGTKLIAVSDNVKDCYTIHGSFPKDTIKLIYNGVWPAPLTSAHKTAFLMDEFGLTEDTHVIISDGRLDEIKRFDILIDAIAELEPRVPPSIKFKVLIVGDGSQRNALQRQITDNGLGATITLTGFRNDVCDLLNISDVFVLTSRSEGLSCSILEAMAAGLPIVASDVGGNSELVNYANGALVNFGDPSGIALWLLRFLIEPEQRRLKGYESKRRTETMFSFDHMTREYLNVYNSLL